ncbi:hypothetical protein [Piscirickettsia litoralis]|uniref:hypothetical protein n=1 Tax=Piscirickettsia litoralis TaxID=1891921 RepID=UPI001112D242|nr:hypothetical protein [Piscirickettsia litoralis]
MIVNVHGYALKKQTYIKPIVVSVSNSFYDGPAISDSGQQLVFRGNQKNKPVIYLSQLKQGNWSAPQAIITTSTAIKGAGAHFVNFAKASQSGGSVNFNGPMIENNIITFAAQLNNGKTGVFYAQYLNKHWETALIRQTGDKIGKYSIASFDAPYVSQGHIYFLTKLKNTKNKDQSIKAVLEFNPNINKLAEVAISKLSSQKGLHDFWDMSVNSGQFALRATIDKKQNKQNVYVYNDKHVFSPVFSLNKHFKNISFGGPTYFRYSHHDYVANLVLFHKGKKISSYKIYTNIIPNFPWIKSGDSVGNSTFELVGNPTLSIHNGVASMVFQGVTKVKSDNNQTRVGAFLTSFKLPKGNQKSEISIKPIIVSGDKIPDLGTVNKVLVGPVSLRNNTAVLSVELKSNKYALLIININEDK